MNRRLVLMSSFAAVLAAYVAFGEGGLLSGLFQSSAPPDEILPKATGAAQAGLKLNPLEGLDAQSFVAITERPLFNPGRAARPPEPPPPPATPSPPPEPEPVVENPGPVAADYKLLAVSSGPSGRVAAVRLVQTNEVVFLREGQQVQSWTVLSVGPRNVVIGTPEQSIELGMFDTGGDTIAAPAPGATPPMAPPTLTPDSGN